MTWSPPTRCRTRPSRCGTTRWWAGRSVSSPPSAATGPGTLALHPTVGTAAPRVLHDVDAVVHVRPFAARADLLDDLERAGFHGDVHLVGDAFAPRTVQEAVYEGRAVGTVVGASSPDAARRIRARSPYLLNGASR